MIVTSKSSSSGSLRGRTDELTIDLTSPVIRFREGDRNRTLILELPKLRDTQKQLAGVVSNQEVWDSILRYRLWSIPETRQLQAAMQFEISEALKGSVYPVPPLSLDSVKQVVIMWYRANLSLDRLRLIWNLQPTYQPQTRLTGERTG